MAVPLFRSTFSPVAELPSETHLPVDDPVATNARVESLRRGAVMSGMQPVFEAAVKQTLKEKVTPETLPQILAATAPGKPSRNW